MDNSRRWMWSAAAVTAVAVVAYGLYAAFGGSSGPVPDDGPPRAAMVGWPSASNTGVPAGTGLTPYDGPCQITDDNTVIDARR